METVTSNSQIPGHTLVKLILFIAISFGWCHISIGQDCKQRYEKELQPLLKINQYQKAIALAKNLAQDCPTFYPNQATLADLLWETKDTVAALEAAKSLISNFPNEKRPYQQLVRKLSEAGLYKDALAVINQFEDKFKDHQSDANWLKKARQIKWAASQTYEANLWTGRELPSVVNTVDDEGLASLNPLENKLLFTRRSGSSEKLMIAEWDSTNSWNTSEVLIPEAGERIGAHTFSADGSKLIFTACDRPDSRGRCDLYESILLKDGSWSVPQNLGNNINTPSWESQPCLSFDGRVLIFSSTREGGKGGSDLWISIYAEDGWSAPSNLTELNTAADEKSPFLHADGRTLFFASNGREESFGMLDLYVSHYDLESKKWSLPLNLGSSINTSFNESGLTINSRGNRGFINRFQPGKGEELFEIGVKNEWKVPKMSVLQLKGALVSNTNFSWSLVNLQNGQLLPDQWIRSVDSSILVVFDIQNPHALLGKAPGFLPVSINLTDSISSVISKMVLPEKIAPGRSLTLSNIFFETNSFTLNPQSESELDFLAEWMNENKGWTFEIGGHTDNLGSLSDNKLLSQRRADVVKEGLIRRGVSAKRLITMGYGAQLPIGNNNSAAGRAKNRRTVLKILEKSDK